MRKYADRRNDRDSHQQTRRDRRQRRDGGIAPAPAPGSLDSADRPRQDRLARQVAAQVLGQRPRRGVPPLPAPSPGTSGRSSPGRAAPAALSCRGGTGSSLDAPGAACPAAWPPGTAAGRSAGSRGSRPGRRRRPPGRRRLAAAGLLGRHVAGRAHDLARAGQAAVGLQLLGQAEVGDARVAVARRAGCWPASGRGGSRRCWWAYSMASATFTISAAASRGGSGPSASRWRQALALDEAHAEVVLALVLADLVDRHDARDGRGWPPPRPRVWNRLTSVSSASWPARIIFSATGRLRLTCRAWKTTPMPPRAISRSDLVVAEVADAVRRGGIGLGRSG